MPSWSSKDERKYEKIKEGYEERGTPEERAEEIAARTVNKSRRVEGRTPNRTTQGTGNPRERLEEHTVEELRNLASDHGIDGRSRMNKEELIEALRGRKS